ncbi:sulfotransferase [Sphingomonas sp. ASV193]|uniref:tetratricopeptide repeat-containing sulfotransferase family protein n=1 Tax=Sphingomonas sp. ASV193 TaxID=3144405 RepID=UPI0032E8DB73
MTAPSAASRYHPRLIEAARAMNENRLDVAERLLKPHLKDDPFDVFAIRMLAELAARIGRLRDSEALLRRALEIAPGFDAARSNLAMVLGRLGRPAEAFELLEPLFEREPDNLGHKNLKAATLARLGDFEAAIALYEEVLARAPAQPRLWTSYGHMLKTIGRQEEGIAAYREAIARQPTLGEAWWSLANLKTVRFDADDIDAMRAALARDDLREEDRWHLDFALGKALHDAKQPDDAFAHYEAANARRRRFHPPRIDEMEKMVERLVSSFTGELIRAAGGNAARDPIFVVGMPRAGSTLVEQILASHPLIEGTSELPDLPAVARTAGYPERLAAMTPDERAAAGTEYLRRASVQRRTERPLFIDKLPNNWLYVPFIRLVLPNATIIDARRHPLGCCFSNFRQHFAQGQEFAYDLADLGRYYRAYVTLMAHLDRVMPGKVHRVIYERMVDDTEAEVRRLLDHVGVPFDPACLEYWKTDRAVRTASSEQVRRPIYRDGTEEWRAYARHLAPLEAALGDVLDAYPDAPATLLQHR